MRAKDVKHAGAALLPLLFLLTTVSAHAGVVFEVETTYHSGGGSESESSQMSVNKPNLKIGIAPSAGSTNSDAGEAIFRGDRREMVIVDHGDKSYMVADKATAERVGGQVQQAMHGLEEELSKLDPQRRAMVEKMMKNGIGGMGIPGAAAPPPKPTKDFRNTGERATKAGYPCVKYEVLEDGRKIRELWVTDWDNVEGASESRGVFEDMASFYSELMGSFSQSSGIGAGFMSGDSFLEGFANHEGFPVVTREFDDGQLDSETVLHSVVERDLDPDAFEPPKGYRLRTMGPQ